MITIIVGSQTGTAEFVADDILSLCQEQGLTAEVTLTTDHLTTTEPQTWLICTSTHGAGELPDNLKPFDAWLDRQQDLSKINFLIIALGDTSYDTYCQAGFHLEKKLSAANANKLTETFTVDAMNEELPEDLVIPWLTKILASTEI